MQAKARPSQAAEISSTGCVPSSPGGDGSDRRGDLASAITCFTPGTAITTIRGPVAVERLRSGDKVLTRDRGFQPVLWRGERCLPFGADAPGHDVPKPVLVRAGALGAGQPERDMVVSPRHRLLVTDRRLLAACGETEALIEARALFGRPGISAIDPDAVRYIHLLFEHHEVILSENIWSESFQLGAPTVSVLLSAQHSEILSLFPDLRSGSNAGLQAAARLCLSPGDLAQAMQG